MNGKTRVLGGVLVLLVAAAGCAGTNSGSSNSLEGLLNENLERASSTLRGIMGADDATGAHQVLLEVDAEIADVVKRAAKASPDVQFNLAEQARKALPELEMAASRAMQQPGVGEKIGGSVNSIVKRLEQLIGTQG